MSAELKHERARYERVFVYLLHDKPHLAHSGYHEIKPHTVSIELDRVKEHEPWEIEWATVRGPRILKSGNVGVREEAHIYTCRNGMVVDPEAPGWLVALVDETYKRAEQERTTRPADNNCKHCNARIYKLDQTGADAINHARPDDADPDDPAYAEANAGDWANTVTGVSCTDADAHEPNEESP